jgi:CheY-like chemotaxis protein
MRTLVVDDNSTSRLILREILTGWGALVIEAHNGPMGLDHLREATSRDEVPTLILLDCRMPAMDGFEVAERIRGEMGSSKTTILMLTSDNRRGDIQRSRDLGLAAYLVKPIRRHELREALALALGYAKAANVPQASQPQLNEEPGLSILLVDDSEDNRLLIQAHLKKTPHRVDFAENGALGFERFKESRYDLVFMDIQMPVLDGYGATRMIRAWEAEHGMGPTPVVALTANAMAEDVKRSLEAGCTSHLAKPIKKKDLLETIGACRLRDEMTIRS